MLKQLTLVFICSLTLIACDNKKSSTDNTASSAEESQTEPTEVNVYSARKEALILPVLDRFTEKTGIKVNLLTGKADALISRIASEGKLGSADILITTDIGRLMRAKQQGLTQPVESDFLKQTIPVNLRDTENHWFALTTRARPILYSIANVKPEQLKDIEGLTSPDWLGKICIRSSSNIYNQSLIAAMLVQRGEALTTEFAKGLVANFARPPKGGDRDQIKAVAAGQCDIAIANTYYLAGMLTSQDESQVAAAQKVKVFWPNQSNRGAHINVSGTLITKHSPNPEAAKALLEFMLEKESQAWYAEHNHEYPVRSDVEQSEVLKSMGSFTAENIDLSKVGELNGEALKLMDKAGWK
ncbi:MAG: Fe(3+) ABC transporter substrate-binding protein [Pseudomonadales bacterium]|nr:Fe(3+) ABC transporter substrate-binding protein [Pseudomonadales bacterium]